MSLPVIDVSLEIKLVKNRQLESELIYIDKEISTKFTELQDLDKTILETKEVLIKIRDTKLKKLSEVQELYKDHLEVKRSIEKLELEIDKENKALQAPRDKLEKLKEEKEKLKEQIKEDSEHIEKLEQQKSTQDSSFGTSVYETILQFCKDNYANNCERKSVLVSKIYEHYSSHLLKGSKNIKVKSKELDVLLKRSEALHAKYQESTSKYDKITRKYFRGERTLEKLEKSKEIQMKEFVSAKIKRNDILIEIERLENEIKLHKNE